MGKLHEILAVRDDRKKAVAKLVQEATTTFVKRQDHFDAETVTYEATTEEGREVRDMFESGKNTEMVTTVSDKLAFIQGPIINFLDTIFQQEFANTEAKANIVIDKVDGSEEVLIENIPVVFLVQLENQLEDLRKTVYNFIPTLDPKITWEKDETQDNVWKQKRPLETAKTKKVTRPIVLYDATEKHPAQTQMISEDIVVGKTIKTSSTGRLSPRQKSQLIANVDRLVAGVKKARARANQQNVEKKKIGKILFDFINSNGSGE